MPARKAIASGKWSDNIWDVTPGNGDDVFANSFTVEIDQNVNVGSLRTTVSGSYAVAGGGFTLYQPLSVIASPRGIFGFPNATCLTSYLSSGTCFVTAPSSIGTGTNAIGISNQSTGTVYFIGEAFGNTTSSGERGISNDSTGMVVLSGNVYGGSNATSYGVFNNSAGTVILYGNAVGGRNNGSAPAIFQNSTGTLLVSGTITASPNAHGVVSANTAARNEFTGTLVNSISGRQAVYCARYLVHPKMFDSSTKQAVDNAGTYVTYFAPEAYSSTFVPHTSSVRAGTAYAAVSSLSGAQINIPTQLFGTMNVPLPSTVAYGVPVESTTGTSINSVAALQNLWNIDTNNIKTTNSLGSILKDTATIQNVGELFAYGNTITSPNQITGLQLWLDATTGVLDGTGSSLLNNGSSIAIWQDQSGNNRHSTQTTTGSRPALLTNILNGRNCVFFDGTDWMQGISFPNLLNYTMFAVYRRRNTTSSPTGFVFCTGVDGNSSDIARLTQLVYHNSAINPPGYNAFGWPVKVTPSNNLDIHLPRNDNFNIHSCTASLVNGTAEYRLNSAGNVVTLNFPSQSTSIGSSIYTLGTKTWGQTDLSYMANCDIAEIIIYDSVLTVKQRLGVEQYLNIKWGIY